MRMNYRKNDDNTYSAEISFEDKDRTLRVLVLGTIETCRIELQDGFYLEKCWRYVPEPGLVNSEGIGFDAEKIERMKLREVKSELEARLWVAMFGFRDAGVARVVTS